MAYRRSPRVQQRLEENRNRILSAARSLVAQGGFREASIVAVAGAADMSTGAVYRYFPSKSDLFVELLTDAVQRECAILRAIIARPATAPDRLAAAVESFARRALSGPWLAYAFIIEPVDPEVEAARLVCRREFGSVFKEVVRQGVASGEFPEQSANVSAACIVGAFTEALARPVTPLAGRISKTRLVGEIVDFCCRAVGASTRTGR
ncbi:TetR/AcrR family transcriptional regulator [Dokdonella sp. MW10]|uniref:TetR/AcrR family transcriptional regulator n=1 Tax=Dokdonella sp. MW10 TaxID=2992926 RepID=UPI003F7E1C03